MNLSDLRKKIDQLDEKILGLLNKRAEQVIKVSRLKEKTNMELYSPEREAKILSRLKAVAGNKPGSY